MVAVPACWPIAGTSVRTRSAAFEGGRDGLGWYCHILSTHDSRLATTARPHRPGLKAGRLLDSAGIHQSLLTPF
ncbi:hypothetical protein CCHR01_02258 [Colletotrichum chrysophilum]|uniref:Uncharacterized protein n=1 Tax=Colletotrichum chrysophilum TaxID=1836956 RepID=A0AAD9AW17_9PEZI|nr:hypothetical protein CCHR01_02258 [Colletotrichum chrysophilum]